MIAIHYVTSICTIIVGQWSVCWQLKSTSNKTLSSEVYRVDCWASKCTADLQIESPIWVSGTRWLADLGKQCQLVSYQMSATYISSVSSSSQPVSFDSTITRHIARSSVRHIGPLHDIVHGGSGLNHVTSIFRCSNHACTCTDSRESDTKLGTWKQF